MTETRLIVHVQRHFALVLVRSAPLPAVVHVGNMIPELDRKFESRLGDSPHEEFGRGRGVVVIAARGPCVGYLG